MRYTKQHKQQGLTSKDVQLLSVLEKERHMSIAALARRAKVSRTTAAYRLSLLEEKDFVARKRVQGHHEWRCVAKGIVGSSFHTLGYRHTAYSGLSEVVQLLRRVVSKTRGKRIYYIEPYSQVKKYATLPAKLIAGIAELFQEKEHISEGVISEAAVALLTDYDKPTLRAMLERMTIVYTIPDRFLQFNEMFLVHDADVYMINMDKQRAIHVTSEEFAAAIVSFIQALQNYGTRYNINKAINEELIRRENCG